MFTCEGYFALSSLRYIYIRRVFCSFEPGICLHVKVFCSFETVICLHVKGILLFRDWDMLLLYWIKHGDTREIVDFENLEKIITTRKNRRFQNLEKL